MASGYLVRLYFLLLGWKVSYKQMVRGSIAEMATKDQLTSNIGSGVTGHLAMSKEAAYLLSIATVCFSLDN
jgi:hypothetical protein